MVEINLLPWRKSVRLHKQKQLFWLGIGGGSGLLIFIIFLHSIFSNFIAENKAQQVKLNLKLMHFIVLTSPQVTPLPPPELKQNVLNQQRLFRLLNKMTMLQQHIQLIKLIYADQRIQVSGQVRALVELTHWLQALGAIHPLMSEVKALSNTDLLQFQLFI